MRKIQPSFQKSAGEIEHVFTAGLSRLADNWFMAGEINRHSERTTQARRELLKKLSWFLAHKSLDVCDIAALRAFLHHATNGHKEEGGRWGNPRMTKPTTPGTVKTYHRILRAFFNHLVTEGELDASPMERIPPPIDRPDQVVPFTLEQLAALIQAATRGNNPKRDEAILLLLLDTGLRATELCDLLVSDVDFDGGAVLVRDGKGGKSRTVPFSAHTKKSLFQYLREAPRDVHQALFLADRGGGAGGAGGAMTRHGLRFLINRLAKRAGISGKRLCPHTMRHSFAVVFIGNGGNVASLQMMLGHTTAKQSLAYVNMANADVQAAHRAFSPVSALKKQKGQSK